MGSTSGGGGGGGGGRVAKVVVIGKGGVGKTAVLRRLVEGRWAEGGSETVGVECSAVELAEGEERWTLQLWDTAGQERFRSLRTPFYRGADAAVLVFGLDDPASFRRLAFWLGEFLRHAGVPSPERFPLLVLGNKRDGERRVSRAEAEAWAAQAGLFPYAETSAKEEAGGVPEAFRTLLHSIRNLSPQTQEHEDREASATVTLHRSPSRQHHSLALHNTSRSRSSRCAC